MSEETEKKDEAGTGAEKPAETPARSAQAIVARPMSASRPSDLALRPGFRNPPNARSKAQKKAKKKR